MVTASLSFTVITSPPANAFAPSWHILTLLYHPLWLAPDKPGQSIGKETNVLGVGGCGI